MFEAITNNLIWVYFVGAIIVVLIVWFLLKTFFDIAVDIWKMPFAVLCDVLDFMGLSNPIFEIIGALASVLFFWILAKDGHAMSKFFGFVSAGEILIGGFYLKRFGGMTRVFPTATVLMLIAIWAD